MKKVLLFALALLAMLLMVSCGVQKTAEPAQTEKPASTGQVEKRDAKDKETSIELTGPWHLDENENNAEVLNEMFPGYAEFGGSMEIRSDGRMSWHIGEKSGVGTYTLAEDVLHAELAEGAEQKAVKRDFAVSVQNEEAVLIMEYEGKSIYWTYGDQPDNPAGGDTATGTAETPDEDVVELINRKGDTTTAYKLDDGKYMDREGTVYIFDGSETWTDQNGAEWNMTLK